MPQYTVGHKERIHKAKAYMRENFPGIYFGGGSYEGSGLPDCIDQGIAAVQNILEFLALSDQRESVPIVV